MVDVKEIVEVLGGRQVLKREVRTLGELRQEVERGLPKSALRNAILQAVPRSESQSEIYKVVPRATYSRRGSLNRAGSERTERLARAVATARYVWDHDEEAVRRFMRTPHPELEGETPLEASRSELGARQVESVLWKVFYGLPV